MGGNNSAEEYWLKVYCDIVQNLKPVLDAKMEMAMYINLHLYTEQQPSTFSRGYSYILYKVKLLGREIKLTKMENIYDKKQMPILCSFNSVM